MTLQAALDSEGAPIAVVLPISAYAYNLVSIFGEPINFFVLDEDWFTLKEMDDLERVVEITNDNNGCWVALVKIRNSSHARMKIARILGENHV
jgi:hypothetical protein